MRVPLKIRKHIERTQKESQAWKRKYSCEIGQMRYERDAWRRLAMHMRNCVVMDDCEECENLWGIATKEKHGNRY